MILIEPDNHSSGTVSTQHVLSVIARNSSSTALILLPGVQYYTGQFLDIQRITSFAHSHGIVIGWDLAHAVGNVELHMSQWNVDFAAWCNYKYINSGPGAIGGLFVNSRHGNVDLSAMKRGEESYRRRLAGWWGGDKAVRFEMGNGRYPTPLLRMQPLHSSLCSAYSVSDFVPIPGAAGFQLGNPSALDLTAVIASLEVFSLTSMSAIRKKSVHLTAYLESLLLDPPRGEFSDQVELPYQIITPSDTSARGAQLSILLKPGTLDTVMKILEEAGVVVDERRPDVLRVAPAPLYNTYTEVWDFVEIFTAACWQARRGQINGDNETIDRKGKDENG